MFLLNDSPTFLSGTETIPFRGIKRFQEISVLVKYHKRKLPSGDSSKLVALDGLDPRQGAAEAGAAFLKAFIDHMVERAAQLLERPVSDGSMRVE